MHFTIVKAKPSPLHYRTSTQTLFFEASQAGLVYDRKKHFLKSYVWLVNLLFYGSLTFYRSFRGQLITLLDSTVLIATFTQFTSYIDVFNFTDTFKKITYAGYMIDFPFQKDYYG